MHHAECNRCFFCRQALQTPEPFPAAADSSIQAIRQHSNIPDDVIGCYFILYFDYTQAECRSCGLNIVRI